ncbi:LCP family protein [Streptomyces sp. NPDC048172]|uniref:LCP family protein n=1 Tax=Streptomyces sp. NPDC048172 TaxID=3365505 RepID=UPI00371E7B09
MKTDPPDQWVEPGGNTPYAPYDPYARYDPYAPHEPYEPYAQHTVYAPHSPYSPHAPELYDPGAGPEPEPEPWRETAPALQHRSREVYGWRGNQPRGQRTRRRPRRRRKVLRALLVLVLALVTGAGGTFAWAENELNRDVDLGKYGHRPPPGKGTNYLIVGSDSRDGLSEGDKKSLHAGGGGGRRTDSMIVLHTGARGATMVSLPRDSWVTVPSYLSPSTGKRSADEKDKLNASFAYGGPELLTRTVEHNTGLRIDHYAEIGFAGFVNIVDAVGGVRMCLERDIKDKKSGADLKRGCQTLDGSQALAFVRQRHQEAEGDLGRSQNQQKFLSALAHKAVKPGTALNPASTYPAMKAGLDTLVVDENMGLRDLATMFRALQGVAGGKGNQINVPVSGVGIGTKKGSAIQWDEGQARKLFGQLRDDSPVTVRGGRTS